MAMMKGCRSSLRRFSHAVAIAIAFVMIAGVAGAAELRIASWNALHLGWDNGKDYGALAEVVQHFDLIAVQEVMNEEGIETLRRAMEDRTEESWSVLSSHLVGRGSYSEMYSFLWRDSAVNYVDGAVVYIDSRDAFAREPFAARFQSTDGSLRFVMATVHAIYGDTEAERQAEARALRDYWTWLAEVFPDDPLTILSGDFNLPPGDPAWRPLKEHAVPLITSGATTLSPRNGTYVSLYDNLWVSPAVLGITRGADILGYPQAILDWDHETARDVVSDHAPVWMVIDSAEGMPMLAPATPILPYAGKTPTDGRPGDGNSLPPVIGNKNSMIFHWDGCPGYESTAPANRVPFATPDAAETAGYRAARNC